MERLVVRNSIDEAIISLQRTKQVTIDAAIDSKKKEKVSTKELLNLFGKVGKDKDGKPFIFAQEDGRTNRAPPRAADHESDEEGDGMVDDV
jgi:phosphoenolpyruvate carboxylase